MRCFCFGRCCLDGRSGGAAFEQLWCSTDRPEHAPLRLSSPHLLRGCSRAGGISFVRCRGDNRYDSRYGGAASEQHRRYPIALNTHCLASTVLTCSVAAFVLVASASSAVAVMAAQAALLPSSFDVHPIALSTHRFGVAVFARRGCLLACGISFGRCCLDGRSGGAASAAMAFIRSPNARIASASAVLICSVAAFVLVASALTAVA